MHICRKSRKPALSHKGPSARELCAQPQPKDQGTAESQNSKRKRKERKKKGKKERCLREWDGNVINDKCRQLEPVKASVCSALLCRNVTCLLTVVSRSCACGRKQVRWDSASSWFESPQIVCVPALIDLATLHFPWSSVPSWPHDGWRIAQRSE